MRRRRVLTLTGAGTALFAGCLSGSDDSDSTKTDNENGDPDEGQTENGDNGDDTSGDLNPGEDGESPPEDILETHQAALESAGSFSTKIDMTAETYSGMRQSPDSVNEPVVTMSYDYGTETGLFESRLDDSLYGEYQTEDTLYINSGWTDSIRESSQDFSLSVAEDIDYIDQGDGFVLADHADDFGKVGSTTYGGQEVTEYQVHEQDSYDEFEATLYVSDDGVVVYIEWDYVDPYDSGRSEVTGTWEFSEFGTTTVSEPDWVPNNE